MPTQVIVLNGASSSGKSSIAAALATLLPRPLQTFGVDSLISALPPGSGSGIDLGADGVVSLDDTFRRLEDAWYEGLAAIARGGVGVIVDEVFLGGVRSQRRLEAALSGLDVLWAGTRCDLDVLLAREAARPDRTHGMASTQARVVHDGVHYEVEVDTTTAAAPDCARAILAHVDEG